MAMVSLTTPQKTIRTGEWAMKMAIIRSACAKHWLARAGSW
jgi:hypothetical protein